MDEDEIKILENVEEKLCFSQHEPEFNDFFYSGFLERSFQLYIYHIVDITRKIIKQKEFLIYFKVTIGHLKKQYPITKEYFFQNDGYRIK